ncbi:hypothetical protein LJC64_00445 [Ruminococcaceae bacterium OttesenSCG-928-A11]|nr:hypothetical protein [Ruminococcaceae bacterium OttesenSCG-928-A11]
MEHLIFFGWLHKWKEVYLCMLQKWPEGISARRKVCVQKMLKNSVSAIILEKIWVVLFFGVCYDNSCQEVCLGWLVDGVDPHPLAGFKRKQKGEGTAVLVGALPVLAVSSQE